MTADKSTTKSPFASPNRVERSIAELEGDFNKEIGIVAASRFITTVDTENLEERLAQISPKFRELVEGVAKNNILTFDAIIDECTRKGHYAGGWTAVRDWARRQPWVAEETKRVAEILARQNTSPEEDEAAGRAFAEQGRMLGMLRVHLMRATTDEERDSIKKQIEELEAAFEKANRQLP